jgi:transposase
MCVQEGKRLLFSVSLFPMLAPGQRGGRPRGVNLREVLDAIFYVLTTGCQWHALSKDLPPRSTAHHYWSRRGGGWNWVGVVSG